MMDICFVIVVYNRVYSKTESFLSFLSLYNSFNDIRFHIIIYDNSPESQEIFLSDEYQLIYYHDVRNLGVVPAYQYGINYCKDNGIKWMLRLDQDSSFDKNLLDSFLTLVNENKDQDVAVVIPKILCNNILESPTYVIYAGLYKPVEDNAKGVLQKRITFINSMSFININNDIIVNAINNCSFYLDLSDHDVAYNLKPENVYVMDVFVSHSLSISEEGYVSNNRYISILNAENIFAKKYYGIIEFFVFKCRLVARSLKHLLQGRKEIALLTIKRLFE